MTLLAHRHLLRRARAVRAGEAPVSSPCMSVCRMQASGPHCEGCLRTLDEIAAWGRMDDDARRAVWALIELRVAEADA